VNDGYSLNRSWNIQGYHCHFISMQCPPESIKQTIPKSFLGALILISCFMCFVTWDQSYWWSHKEDYVFGWLVPVFVGYVLFDRWPRISGWFRADLAPASKTASAWSQLLTVGAWLGVFCGGGLFLIGAAFRAAGGPSYTGTISLALGTGILTLAVFYLLAPGSISAASGKTLGRENLVLIFVFPAFVWLVSAPMLTGFENTLSGFLRHQVTTVVFSVFDVLGFPLEQRGNVLILPKGSAGVEDACSGIRSLTGCLFAGSFLAAVSTESLVRKVTLVMLALLLAFLGNLARGLFLTAWSYRYGPEAIEGTVHDLTGYAVLGLTVVGLLCALPLIAPKMLRVKGPVG
jgi:exosortase